MAKGCHGREPLLHSYSHLCPHLPLQGRVSRSQEEGQAAPVFGNGFQGCTVWGSLTAAPQRAMAAAAASLRRFPFQPPLGSGAGKSSRISFLILILIFFILKHLRHARSEQQKKKKKKKSMRPANRTQAGAAAGGCAGTGYPPVAVGLQPVGPFCTLVAHLRAQGRAGSDLGSPPTVTSPASLCHAASRTSQSKDHGR